MPCDGRPNFSNGYFRHPTSTSTSAGLRTNGGGRVAHRIRPWQHGRRVSRGSSASVRTTCLLARLEPSRAARTPDVGWFDNRSFVTPAEFPSADFHKRHGVSRIVLVQIESKIQVDLLEVLLCWQRDGLKLFQQPMGDPWKPRLATVKRPPLAVYLWERLRRAIGYPRNPMGSFGHMVRAGSG